MGFVKDFYYIEPNDYNAEYFYALQDEYEQYEDDIGDMQIDAEYNIAEILRVKHLLGEISQATGIASDDATAALTEFINEYEVYMGLDK